MPQRKDRRQLKQLTPADPLELPVVDSRFISAPLLQLRVDVIRPSSKRCKQTVEQSTPSGKPTAVFGLRSNIRHRHFLQMGARGMIICITFLCRARWASSQPVSGSSSAVERQLPKLDVAGSIPVSRSRISFCVAMGNRIGSLFSPAQAILTAFQGIGSEVCPC